jgi:hypothetical protein
MLDTQNLPGTIWRRVLWSRRLGGSLVGCWILLSFCRVCSIMRGASLKRSRLVPFNSWSGSRSIQVRIGSYVLILTLLPADLPECVWRLCSCVIFELLATHSSRAHVYGRNYPLNKEDHIKCVISIVNRVVHSCAMNRRLAQETVTVYL